MKENFAYANDGADGSMHAVSDGRFAVMVKGADIYRLQPLDGANALSARFFADVKTSFTSARERGKNRWRYELEVEGEKGIMSEYITVNGVFVRELNINKKMTAELVLSKFAEKIGDNLFVVKKGTSYVNDYPTAEDFFVKICGKNCAFFCDGNKIRAEFSVGECALYIAMGRSAEQTARAIGKEYDFVYPKPPAASKRLAEAIEDYYTLFRSYSTQGGGTISAMEWNLAYVRDLYGAARGLMEAGFYDDVKQMLLFYKRQFDRHGKIATAYSVGNDYSLHIHECDEAENTGYLILEAFEYYERTGDKSTFEKILPFAKWCFYAQLRNLYKGMLPFSGDETYTAGGMLPKVHLDDGSAESTLLFIESGKKILPYLNDPDAEKKWAFARDKYRENFTVSGVYFTNNPARREKPPVALRKGVCVYCYKYADGLKPNRYNLFTCAECADKTEDLRSNKIYELSCVCLMPVYLRSDIFTERETREISERTAQRILDGKGGSQNGRITGYEYGLALYGLVRAKSPLAEKMYEATLAARDGEGVWSEYYENGKRCGMRWRIWEGGVNIMALLAYEKAAARGDFND